jgi:hypothetical protein
MKLSWKHNEYLEIQPKLFLFQLSFGRICSFGCLVTLAIQPTAISHMVDIVHTLDMYWSLSSVRNSPKLQVLFGSRLETGD